MGLLVAIFLLLNIRRLFKLAVVCLVLLVATNVTQTDNRRYVAHTWLRAIPGSYDPILLPNYYSRFVESPHDLTLSRLDTIVSWHKPDTIVFLYDRSVKLAIIDSLGETIAGRPVLLLDAASGYDASNGYEKSNRRVAGLLASSRSLLVGTPLQVAGPVAYFMREAGYSRLRINITVNWDEDHPLRDEYAKVMVPFK